MKDKMIDKMEMNELGYFFFCRTRELLDMLFVELAGMKGDILRNMSAQYRHCTLCGVGKSHKRCAGCHITRYCSEECQRYEKGERQRHLVSNI